MATTNFMTGITIESDWLNDVDAAVYETLPLKATTAALNDHIADTTAAHASSTISYTALGTGAITTTVEAKLQKLLVSVKDFGAVGNSTGATGNGADDTAAFQAAVNYAVSIGAALYVPAGVYRLTAPIVSTKGFRLRGEAVQPYQDSIGTAGNGSWLYFDHLGKGMTIGSVTIASSGFEVKDIGTRRNQPVPATGWVPAANDFDFSIDNCDSHFDNVLLLNATKGILLDNGSYGRLSFRRLRGQCFVVGLQIETSYDVVSGEQFHLWPFWADNTDVHAYTMNNLDAIYLKRCDNPKFTNVFTIFARAGIRFGQNVNGATSKIKLTNADFDRGQDGIWVDTTVTNGVTGQFTNVTHQGETGFANSVAVNVEGNNSQLDFTSFRSDLSYQNGVRAAGTDNYLRFGLATIRNWNKAATGFPAFEALTGNTIEFSTPPQTSGGGAAARFGGAGSFNVDEWITYTPTVTSGTGTITTLGAVSGRYRRRQGIVDYYLDITITTNGTAASSVVATLPLTSNAENTVGGGRETAVTGVALQALVAASASSVNIHRYDNTYPGGDGRVMIVSGSYRVP